MLAVLSKNGAIIVDDENDADVIVVNTCSFISDAKEESINTIIELSQLKKTGKLKTLVVTGCLAQRYSDEILASLPEVDVILGVDVIDGIFEAIKAAKDNKVVLTPEAATLPDISNGRVVTTGGHYAHLKISEGCDKRCTYCAIPSFRGSYRSIPMEILVKEATELAKNGVKELILVAQEITVYGKDIYGKKALPGLVKKLSEIDGIEWIRLLYCYPEEIDEGFINMMATNKKVCHYIDMPIQHCSDDILRRMARRTNKAELIEKIKLLRNRIPDICIRTTLIAGFPGEKKKHHLEAVDFIKEIKFDRLGVFSYSREDGTVAAGYKSQVPNFIKNKRRDALMAIQQDIVFENNPSFVGKEMDAFIEGYLPKENIYVARTYRDAPEVDGLVFIKSDRELMSGDFVKVKITEAKGYDLIGELL